MCGALFDVEPCPFDAEPVNFDATLGAGAGSCFDSDSDYVIKVIINRSKKLLKKQLYSKKFKYYGKEINTLSFINFFEVEKIL